MENIVLFKGKGGIEMREYENFTNEQLLIANGKKEIKNLEEFLIEKNIVFLKELADNYYIRGYEKDDNLQEVILSFCKAIKKFDIEKNIKLKTFATAIIKNDFNMKLKKSIRYEESLSELIENGFDIKSNYSLEEQVIKREEINKLKELSKEQMEILRIIFYRDIESLALAREFDNSSGKNKKIQRHSPYLGTWA